MLPENQNQDQKPELHQLKTASNGWIADPGERQPPYKGEMDLGHFPIDKRIQTRALSTPEISLPKKTSDSLLAVYSASNVFTNIKKPREQVVFKKPHGRVRSTSTPNIKHETALDKIILQQDGKITPSKLYLPSLDSSLTVISLSRTSTPFDKDEDWETPRSARSRSTTPLGRSTPGKWAAARRNPLSSVRLDPLKNSSQFDEQVMVSSVASTPRKKVGLLGEHQAFGDQLAAIEEHLHEQSLKSSAQHSPVPNGQNLELYGDSPRNSIPTPRSSVALTEHNHRPIESTVLVPSMLHDGASRFSPPLVDSVNGQMKFNHSKKYLTFENLLKANQNGNNNNYIANEPSNQVALDRENVVQFDSSQLNRKNINPKKEEKKHSGEKTKRSPSNAGKMKENMALGIESDKVKHTDAKGKHLMQTEEIQLTDPSKHQPNHLSNSPLENAKSKEVENIPVEGEIGNKKQGNNVGPQEETLSNPKSDTSKNHQKHDRDKSKLVIAETRSHPFSDRKDSQSSDKIPQLVESDEKPAAKSKNVGISKSETPIGLTILDFGKADQDLKDLIKEENRLNDLDKPASLTLHVSDQDKAVKITVNLNGNVEQSDKGTVTRLSPTTSSNPVDKKKSKPIKNNKLFNANVKSPIKKGEQTKTRKLNEKETQLQQLDVKRKRKNISLRNLPVQKNKSTVPSGPAAKKDKSIPQHKDSRAPSDSPKEPGVKLHETVESTQPSNNDSQGSPLKEASGKMEVAGSKGNVQDSTSKTPLQKIVTPIIQEAYPSPATKVAPNHVSNTKNTNIFPRKIKTAESRMKSANNSAKQRGQTKSGKKQSLESMPNCKFRSKSAGLAVEKRAKGKKMSKKDKVDAPEISPKIDDNEALISGKSWSVVVSKNEEGQNIVLKCPEESISPNHNEIQQVVNPTNITKLSPIPEMLTNSLKSPAVSVRSSLEKASLAVEGSQLLPNNPDPKINEISTSPNIPEVNEKVDMHEDCNNNIQQAPLADSTYSEHVQKLLHLPVDEGSDEDSDKTLTDGESSTSDDEDELLSFQKRILQPRSEVDALVLIKYPKMESDDEGSTLKSTGSLMQVETNGELGMHGKIEDVPDDDQLSLIGCEIDKPEHYGVARLREESLREAFSEDDSEAEMLEHMQKTLNYFDDEENFSSESECSIHLEDTETKSQTPKLSRQLTMSALKQHNETMVDEAENDGRHNGVQSQATETTEESLLTNTTVSVANLNTEKCMGWQKGPLIDQGAFGKVWQGMTHGGQLIAVKQVELSLSRTEAQKEYESVQREVDILKEMKHPNIVSFIGTCLDDNVVSIFMEFLTGGSISSILRNFGALQEPVFKRYTRQILDGVRFLHQHNVVHRDINGNNIMLLPDGVIKLIDFGCAKRIHERSAASSSRNSAASSANNTLDRQLKSVVGTPFWMAPEVVTGQGHGPKSDVWSIGCTVMEMATTRPPLYEMGSFAAMFHIGEGRPMPQLAKSFTKHARSFVRKCMEIDISKRATSEELFHHRFIKGKQGTRS